MALEVARRAFLRNGLPKIGALLSCAALAAACAGSRGETPDTAKAAASQPGDLLAATPEVREVLEISCYGCHSSQGSIPWYGTLAPSSWFRGGARKALDFSEWQTYDVTRRTAELRHIAAMVRSGEMPPWDYRLLDSSARLDDSQKQAVAQWADSAQTAP